MAKPRQPARSDLLALVKALEACEVEYVVIGGIAMALHGFPRLTKDIDLLLPVDPRNNARLFQALALLPESTGALSALSREWMDKGHSTCVEGEVFIDLLYVAASRSFDELRDHIDRVVLDGVEVATLDIDGILQTKQTPRASDAADRIKLERVRRTMNDERLLAARIEQLRGLVAAEGAAGVFGRLADAALRQASGTDTDIDWRAVEQAAITESIAVHGHPPSDIADVLCRLSPAALHKATQNVLRARITRDAPRLQAVYTSRTEPDAADGSAPGPRNR